MPKMPFKDSFPMTQDWNDPRFRTSYHQFNLLGHNGQDFGCPSGTPIIAPHSGRIIEALLDKTGYGWYVKIENDKEGSILGHFKESPLVKVGDSVKQGQQVGVSGNTGNSTGPHLHWGYYRFPRKRDNGFSGTVDQTHWMNQDDVNHLEELIQMKKEKETVERRLEELEKKCIKDAQSTTEHIKNLQSTVAEQNAQIQQMNETILQSTSENKRLTDDCSALRQSLVDMTLSKKTEIAERDAEILKLSEKYKDLSVELKKLKETIKNNFTGYPWFKRLTSLFHR